MLCVCTKRSEMTIWIAISYDMTLCLYNLSLKSGPVYYLLSWRPSHLRFWLLVTWLLSFYTPSDLEAKSLCKIVISRDLDRWLWISRAPQHRYSYLLRFMHVTFMVHFTIYVLKEISILSVNRLCVWGRRPHPLHCRCVTILLFSVTPNKPSDLGPRDFSEVT